MREKNVMRKVPCPLPREIEAAEFQAFEKELTQRKKDARTAAVANIQPFERALAKRTEHV